MIISKYSSLALFFPAFLLSLLKIIPGFPIFLVSSLKIFIFMSIASISLITQPTPAYGEGVRVGVFILFPS
jgi:hypothetical protein